MGPFLRPIGRAAVRLAVHLGAVVVALGACRAATPTLGSAAAGVAAPSLDSVPPVAVEQAIVRASAARDRAALDTLVDTSFVGTVANGRSFRKAATIARWTAPDTSGEYSVLGDVAVSPSDDGAVVELTDTQHARNGTALRASRVADLVARDGTRWRLAAGIVLRAPLPHDSTVAAVVRDARARWNTAVARRDTGGVRALLGDSVAQSSPAFRRVGAAEYTALMARVMARRPDVALTYSPERVEGGPDAALEAGRWTEGWREAGGAIELAGAYRALWRRTPDGWRIAAELFVATSCAGAGCAR